MSKPFSAATSVHDAFAGRPRPADADMFDWRELSISEEKDAVGTMFRDRDWGDVDLRAGTLEAYEFVIPYSTLLMPVGRAYFLPSFLLEATNSPPGDNGDDDRFVDGLCFILTPPDPDALSKQYDLVKNMPEVPDEIKGYLADPPAAARQTEKLIFDRYREFRKLLSPAEAEATRSTLDFLADCYRADGTDDALNPAIEAIGKGWG